MTEKVNRLPAWQAYCELPDGTLVVQATDYARLERECITAQHEKALAVSDLQRCKSERDAELKRVEVLRAALTSIAENSEDIGAKDCALEALATTSPQ